MNPKEDQIQSSEGKANDKNLASVTTDEKVEMCRVLCGIDKDGSLPLCRVCHCAESDRRGDAALGFLNIAPPSQEGLNANKDEMSTDKATMGDVQNDVAHAKNFQRGSAFVEFLSPDGEIFICSTDIETGSYHHQDALINLGCSCKSDLAIAHYACALKWFIGHGSTVCEICGNVAKNIKPADFKKVIASLKDYEELREMTIAGELATTHIQTNSDVDPDAVAAIRRQRLSEISLWFNPHNNSTAVSQGVTELTSNPPTEVTVPTENPTTKWAVESTGILVATGLLTVTLAWLIAPRVGKVCLDLVLPLWIFLRNNQ